MGLEVVLFNLNKNRVINPRLHKHNYIKGRYAIPPPRGGGASKNVETAFASWNAAGGKRRGDNGRPLRCGEKIKFLAKAPSPPWGGGLFFHQIHCSYCEEC